MLYAVALAVTGWGGASCTSFAATEAGAQETVQAEARRGPVSEERDRILSLLAYSVVYQDWQAQVEDARGYNIGAVLVSPKGDVVAWNLNCNNVLQDGTQHAETRLIQHWLRDVRTYNLDGYEVFTTLEPCAQCSGMMALQKVSRAVYGLSDPLFGRAIERLALDSTSMGGFAPYPRYPASMRARVPLADAMDLAAAASGMGITDWLCTPEARELFERADQELVRHVLTHPENSQVLQQALAVRASVVTADLGLEPKP